MSDELREKLAQRYYNKRRLGVPVDARGSSAKNDIDSGLAEKCACDYLGCKFNDDVLDGNDGGYDFIYKNKKIDVKWIGRKDGVPRTSGRIIVDIHKIGIADIYIAVSGSDEDGFKCIGWCTREFIMEQPMWNSTYPDENNIYERYAVHTNMLNKMIELKNMVS